MADYDNDEAVASHDAQDTATSRQDESTAAIGSQIASQTDGHAGALGRPASSLPIDDKDIVSADDSSVVASVAAVVDNSDPTAQDAATNVPVDTDPVQTVPQMHTPHRERHEALHSPENHFRALNMEVYYDRLSRSVGRQRLFQVSRGVSGASRSNDYRIAMSRQLQPGGVSIDWHDIPHLLPRPYPCLALPGDGDHSAWLSGYSTTSSTGGTDGENSNHGGSEQG